MINDSTSPTLGSRRLSQFSDFGAADGESFAAGPERTSILAIMSLVCGVICIVPFLGLIGVILAIAAFFGISGSKGRVGGTGLAIAGLILGLLTTALWVGGVFAGFAAWGFMEKGLVRVDTTFTAIENGDYAAAADSLGPNAQSLTTADFEAFRAAYQDALGAYVTTPQKFGGYIEGWSAVTETMQAQGQSGPNQQFGGNQGLLPAPAEFERGTALVIYSMNTAGGQPASDGFFDAIDFQIMLPDGTMVSLFNPPLIEGGPAPELEADPADAPADDPSEDGEGA